MGPVQIWHFYALGIWELSKNPEVRSWCHSRAGLPDKQAGGNPVFSKRYRLSLPDQVEDEFRGSDG